MPFYECTINNKRYAIPEYMRSGIELYLTRGIKPGSFLTAVICNDFKGAVGYADDNNLDNLPAYASYFYNEVPSPAWGSPEKMLAWINARMAEDQE